MVWCSTSPTIDKSVLDTPETFPAPLIHTDRGPRLPSGAAHGLDILESGAARGLDVLEWLYPGLFLGNHDTHHWCRLCGHGLAW